jgi:peptidoglycan/LPS O-acetylase OafA/YrhL
MLSSQFTQSVFVNQKSAFLSKQSTTNDQSAPGAGARLLEVDGLRGIAIWLVLLGHFFVLEYAKELGGVSFLALSLCSKFSWGVDLFFVISGFLIGGILLDHRHSAALLKTFYLRRALRIWPLYFLIVLLLLGPMYWMGFPAQSRYVPYWTYLVFGQNVWMSTGFWALFAFGPMWSIAIEEQFYVLAPLLVRRASVGRINTLVFVTICAAVGMRMVCISVPSINPATFTLCRLDAIAVGFFGALLIRNGDVSSQRVLQPRRLRLLVAFMLPAFVGIAACSKLPNYLAPIAPSYVAFFFLAVLLLGIFNPGGMIARALRNRLLLTSGKYCYFLYLFHYTVLDNIGLVIGDRLLVRLASLGVCLLLAAISWRLVESPLIAIGHRHSYDLEPKIDPFVVSPVVSPGHRKSAHSS